MIAGADCRTSSPARSSSSATTETWNGEAVYVAGWPVSERLCRPAVACPTDGALQCCRALQATERWRATLEDERDEDATDDDVDEPAVRVHPVPDLRHRLDCAPVEQEIEEEG